MGLGCQPVARYSLSCYGWLGQGEVVEERGADATAGYGRSSAEGGGATESDDDLWEDDGSEVEPRDVPEAAFGCRVDGVAEVGDAAVAGREERGVEVLVPLLVRAVWGTDLQEPALRPGVKQRL